MDNKEKVLTVMRELGKPVKQSELAKLAQLEDKLLAKTLKELKNEGKITSPKRCFYSISD